MSQGFHYPHFFQIAYDYEILAHRSQLVEGRSYWNMLGRSIMFGLSIAILRDGFRWCISERGEPLPTIDEVGVLIMDSPADACLS